MGLPIHIGRFLFVSLIAVAFVMPASVPSESFAKSKTSVSSKYKSKSFKSSSKKRRSAAQPDRYSALVVDAATGHVLYERNAGAVRYPASLTKMMTLYLTFDALKKGKLSMSQSMAVSEKAASQPQTNIALYAGDTLPVRTAIESMVVRSANDSAMVLAEAIGGTEWNFALMMTKKARELGMKNTVFHNPSGLPDNKQHTTAYDMARLGIALKRDFPEFYPFFSLQSFDHNGVTYNGHNHVMERYNGVDGIKTGFIRASGFNLVTSANRSGHRVVAVVMGGNTAASRDNQMITLLDQTFARLEVQPSRAQQAAAPSKKNDNLVGEGDAAEALPALHR